LGLSIAVLVVAGSSHARRKRQRPLSLRLRELRLPRHPPDEPPPLLKSPELVQFVEAPYPEEAFAQGVEGRSCSFSTSTRRGR
jgi:hypothetical protein